MKGIARLVTSFSRLGVREIVSGGSTVTSSSSSLLISRRSLFISATNLLDSRAINSVLTSSRSSSLPQKWTFLGGMDLLPCLCLVFENCSDFFSEIRLFQA